MFDIDSITNNSDRVLWLSPQQVYPPVDGGKRGIYFSVVELAKQCTCYFAYFHDLPAEQEAE